MRQRRLYMCDAAYGSESQGGNLLLRMNRVPTALDE